MLVEFTSSSKEQLQLSYTHILMCSETLSLPTITDSILLHLAIIVHDRKASVAFAQTPDKSSLELSYPRPPTSIIHVSVKRIRSRQR